MFVFSMGARRERQDQVQLTEQACDERSFNQRIYGAFLRQLANCVVRWDADVCHRKSFGCAYIRRQKLLLPVFLQFPSDSE